MVSVLYNVNVHAWLYIVASILTVYKTVYTCTWLYIVASILTVYKTVYTCTWLYIVAYILTVYKTVYTCTCLQGTYSNSYSIPQKYIQPLTSILNSYVHVSYTFWPVTTCCWPLSNQCSNVIRIHVHVHVYRYMYMYIYLHVHVCTFTYTKQSVILAIARVYRMYYLMASSTKHGPLIYGIVIMVTP